MTDVLILSDLHLEFHKDEGSEFIRSLDPDVDVLVLAGDICAGGQIPKTIGALCQRFKNVIYIHGNHEFYNYTRKQVLDKTEQACKENTNLYWLDNSTAEISGVRFLGTPLWFKNAPTAPKYALNDFYKIREYETWVYEENKKAVEFLATSKPGDVVVTHHLPSRKSVPPEYKNSSLNAFFVCDVENVIMDCQPALWCHGHSHTRSEYFIGKTKVICNPMGYPTELGCENGSFDKGKVVTL
jgi:Icc-related predicted phosphoesterase